MRDGLLGMTGNPVGEHMGPTRIGGAERTFEEGRKHGACGYRYADL
jgi:hypothetical protein